MNIALTDAERCLAELVRRAEAGEAVVLTRDGQPTVRLAPVSAAPQPAGHVSQPRASEGAGRRRIIEEIQAGVRARGIPRTDAARSQDFLYDDETGLPA